MKKAKKDKVIEVGYVKHIGPPKSPRCAIQDPTSHNRRWVLKAGQKSGTMALPITSHLYNWVKNHEHLKFCLVSGRIRVGEDKPSPAPKPKVSERHQEWQEEKKKRTEAKPPKPMGEIPADAPTPKEVLEGATPLSHLKPKEEEELVVEEEEDIISDEKSDEPEEKEPAQEEPDTKEDSIKALNKHTKKELMALAKDFNIEIPKDALKKEMVEILADLGAF